MRAGRRLVLYLRERPQRDAAVGRDRVEVEVLREVLGDPAHLPHRVGVLPRLDGGDVDRGGRLGARVVDGDGAVVPGGAGGEGESGERQVAGGMGSPLLGGMGSCPVLDSSGVRPSYMPHARSDEWFGCQSMHMTPDSVAT